MRWLLVAGVALTLAVPATGATKWPDPRVCDSYNTHGAAAHAKYCAESAGSLLAEKVVVSMIGAPLVYWPACIASKQSLLVLRCYLQHDQPSGPAASVTWDPLTFKPTLKFGPAGLAWIAAAKARVVAARSGG